MKLIWIGKMKMNKNKDCDCELHNLENKEDAERLENSKNQEELKKLFEQEYWYRARGY